MRFIPAVSLVRVQSPLPYEITAPSGFAWRRFFVCRRREGKGLADDWFALARLSLPRTVLFDSEKMHRLTATPGVDIQGSTGPIHVRKGIDDGIAVVEWSARCLLCSETETLLWQAARSGEAFGGSCPVNVV